VLWVAVRIALRPTEAAFCSAIGSSEVPMLGAPLIVRRVARD
jgi:hypothetical protein